jgi:HPt (histidine-containing phosphotransfer) domain-containing protein
MRNNTAKKIVVYADPELEDLIPKFLEHQWDHLTVAKAAIKNSNFKDLQRVGHQMKGTCSGYGFPILGQLGETIEKLAEQQNIEVLSEYVIQFEAYLSQLIVEYKKKP